MEVAIKIFRDFPFFGAGLGMYEELFGKYWCPPLGYEAISYLHAHNTYLEIFSEMGIVGFLAFLWIFAVFFKNTFKTIRNISSDKQVILLGLTGSLIATLIFALFCSIILVGVEISALFWFLFGMASGLLKTKEVT
jgi:O-antigen ligase